ncbi:MAG: hypothetical protein A2X61_00185 [Ignavibacteria bacterium GWB2_35_12]|nr:MAG: hypothetical protein A2X61_00185 [Ignavibacteria bacterium GWB2_35_12]OGU95979.1 MAG: hypothetical protein A2220_16685 [Ignavibacteria bacterium RIFOXYA2_FULL_35_10]OGV24538.1 MAG: hypothetical protein A2475_07580 [Ignavibacteria bacterium RIFOXYC2_FULL_35_21]
MADYPSNFRYQSSDQTLHWDGVEGAIEYEIEYSTDPQKVEWQIAYTGGNDTFCIFIHSQGTYSVRGRTRDKGPWGIYGPIEYVEVVVEP